MQVIADDLRLRANPQNIVAGPFDQHCFPAGRYRAKRIPCMACDETELRGFHAKLPLDVSVSLGRWLMVLHAIRAETPLEEIYDAAMFELASLHLKQIVGEREQPEPASRSLASAAGTSR